MPKGKFAIEAYEDYGAFVREKEEHYHNMEEMDSTALKEERHLKNMFISSLGIKFGISDKIMVSALMPYVLLNTDRGDDKGFGDLVLLGTFGLYSKNDLNIALSSGVEITTKKRKDSSLENTTVAVNSGSIDPMLGVSASKKWNTVILQISTFGKYTTNGFNRTNYGSVNIQNIALSYQLKNKQSKCSSDSLKPETKTRLAVWGGYYGEWPGQKTDKDGIKDENTGYYLGFATVGFSPSYRGFTIPLTLSLPFIEDIRGEQAHYSYRVRLGIVKTF